MSDASTYPVSFPYGATSAPYSPAAPHRGDDRPCPSGTPVMLAGVQIGLTGATGKVTGAHLHIQEWKGNYAATRKPQNSFKPGVVVNVDPEGTQGDGSFGKFITVQTSDGWNDSYCHLSQINVQVGDRIGGDMWNITKEQIDDISRKTNGKLPGTDFNYAHFTGQSATQALLDELLHDLQPQADQYQAEYASLQEQVSAGSGSFKPYSGPTLYEKN